MLVINGSYGEGGGQILRTSLSLSALNSRSIKVINIRKNRPNPGLSKQHVTAVQSAAEVCGATVKGCKQGSLELEFCPSEIRSGDYNFDIGSAGSVTLVLQTILPMLLGTGSTVEITGGTDVKWSPSVDYFQHVFLSFLKKMGAKVECSLVRRGHYPQGGGTVRLTTTPSHLTTIDLRERGVFRGISGKVHVSRIPDNIAFRIKKSAEQTLKKELENRFPFDDGQIDIHRSLEDGTPGCGITLWGKFENTVMGYDLCGERGLPSEKLGALVATTLVQEMLSPTTVDEWCSDQLILYLACQELFSREGRQRNKQEHRQEHHHGEAPSQPPFFVRSISPHLRTNIWVLESFGFYVNKEMTRPTKTA